MNTNYADVLEFLQLLEIPGASVPVPAHELTWPLGVERLKHLKEEVREYEEAFESGDLTKQADSLVDIVYIALGTAIMQGLPWQLLWDEVHRANLRKRRDPLAPRQGVVKPVGWTPPDIAGVLRRAGA